MLDGGLQRAAASFGCPLRRCALPSAIVLTAICLRSARSVGCASSNVVVSAPARWQLASAPGMSPSRINPVHNRPAISASRCATSALWGSACSHCSRIAIAFAKRGERTREIAGGELGATDFFITDDGEPGEGRVLRRERFTNRQRFAIRREGAGGVSKIGELRIAEHVAHTVVGRRQFLAERHVAGALRFQAAEIFQRLRDDELSRGCRARQVCDGVVELEQERALPTAARR